MSATTATGRAMREFLTQQMDQAATQQLVDSIAGGTDAAAVTEDTQLAETIDHAVLEEFKHQVRLWWELDTVVKRLQNAVRERKKMQETLSAKILQFMRDHNIEDLSTADGVLRYKTTLVKPTLSQKVIRQKLEETFEQNPEVKQAISAIFTTQERVEKVSLRRIRI